MIWIAARSKLNHYPFIELFTSQTFPELINSMIMVLVPCSGDVHCGGTRSARNHRSPLFLESAAVWCHPNLRSLTSWVPSVCSLNGSALASAAEDTHDQTQLSLISDFKLSNVNVRNDWLDFHCGIFRNFIKSLPIIPYYSIELHLFWGLNNNTIRHCKCTNNNNLL